MGGGGIGGNHEGAGGKLRLLWRRTGGSGGLDSPAADKHTTRTRSEREKGTGGGQSPGGSGTAIVSLPHTPPRAKR